MPVESDLEQILTLARRQKNIVYQPIGIVGVSEMPTASESAIGSDWEQTLRMLLLRTISICDDSSVIGCGAIWALPLEVDMSTPGYIVST